MTDQPWSQIVKLAEVSALGAGSRLERHLAADAPERRAIAGFLGVEAVDAIEAELELAPWFDGVQIEGRWRAEIVQLCGLTLEPLPSELEGSFVVRAVPPTSALAPLQAGREVIVDPDADDPPDILETGSLDLAAYVVEHVALEIDPFPRKPGAAFEPPNQAPEPSPFEALRALKGAKDIGDSQT